MKKLIILAHPNISNSVINKRLIAEANKYPDKFTVHDISAVYGDKPIDVQKEQVLIKEHGALVLQFPIFWFSSPPILKKWLDEVLTYGFAYGSKSDGMRDRKVALAVTCGIKKSDYQPSGRYKYTLEQILTPFDMTFKQYCHADYRGFFAFYGAEITPGADYSSSEDEIESGAKEYIKFLNEL